MIDVLSREEPGKTGKTTYPLIKVSNNNKLWERQITLFQAVSAEGWAMSLAISGVVGKCICGVLSATGRAGLHYANI